MKKISATIILSMLWLTASCSSITNAVNTATNNNPTALKAPYGNNPGYIKNAKPDTHAAEDSSIIVRVESDEISSIGNGGVLVNGDRFLIDTVGEKLRKLFEKTPAERQLIYLDASRYIKIKTLAEVVHVIRKENVENIALVVTPENKRGVTFDVLKVKVMPEPQPEDDISPTELSKRAYLNLSKDGKIHFAGYDAKNYGLNIEKEEIKPEEMQAKIQERFSKQTGETDKRIFIKGSRSLQYDQIAKMVDAAAGAGAEVYLVIDDLEE